MGMSLRKLSGFSIKYEKGEKTTKDSYANVIFPSPFESKVVLFVFLGQMSLMVVDQVAMNY